MSRRPSLPDELIYSILLKVPVKSLLRFRCVCKSWKTLISNPQFVTNHLHTEPHHQRLASFVYDDQKEIVTCSVQSLFENPSTPAATLTFTMDHNYNIIGSINGLICFRQTGGCFTLWNPSTRFQSNTSPPRISLPRYSTRVGFGYDQVNNKYKVLVHADYDSLHVTRVHTFGTHSWTLINNFPCSPDDDDDEDDQRVGIFVSGTLNWLTGSIIISFDVEKETYGLVSLPIPRWANHNYDDDDDYYDSDDDDDVDCIQHYELNVLNDCLCVCYFSNSTHWVVWLMKKYGVHESWTKLLVIPHDKLITSTHLPAFHPLCILENGLVLAKAAHSLLILYNPSNGASNYVDILGRFGHHIQVYHESLVSP